MKSIEETERPYSVPVVRKRYDFRLGPMDLHKVKGKSRTVPDQSYTIRDILDRLVRGVGPLVNQDYNPGGKDPSHEDPDLSAVMRMDFVDRQEVVDYAKASADDARARFEEARDAHAAKVKEEEAKRMQSELGPLKSDPSLNVGQPRQGPDGSGAKPVVP